MKQRILTWIGMMTLMSLLVLPLAHAKLEYVQGNSPRMMQGARPNGMGGAFIAVKGSDSNAMFTIPPRLMIMVLCQNFSFCFQQLKFPLVQLTMPLIKFQILLMKLMQKVQILARLMRLIVL